MKSSSDSVLPAMNIHAEESGNGYWLATTQVEALGSLTVSSRGATREEAILSVRAGVAEALVTNCGVQMAALRDEMMRLKLAIEELKAGRLPAREFL